MEKYSKAFKDCLMKSGRKKHQNNWESITALLQAGEKSETVKTKLFSET